MNDTLLVQQLKSGNKKVFEQIVNAYWGRLYSFSTIYVIDKESAKEIVQDSFLVLWEKRQNLDNATCFITYLMVVCRNKCLNYLHSLKLDTISIDELNETMIYQRSNLYVLDDSSLEILITKELSESIDRTLDKLPARTKEIFIMSRQYGFKNKEIAEKEQISIKAVEFHINKALKQFRKDLGGEYVLIVVYMFVMFALRK